MLKRYLEKRIVDDLKERMVFIAGPRQVGKTTLALEIGKLHFHGKTSYLNWDDRGDRKKMLEETFNPEHEFIVYDEIHKYRHWKNYLKGIYDKNKSRFKIAVTGSARLDIFRRGGDSLLGRYRLFRLHPLSLNELIGRQSDTAPFEQLKFSPASKETADAFARLSKFGGFPEICLKGSERALRLWHNERIDRLIKGEIRDLENIRDLSALQVMTELIPDRIGSLFSLNSLSEDLGVAHKTAMLWLDILERFYFSYRIRSFRGSKIKSLRKAPKVYLWDWSDIKDEAIRFENHIASHLLKFCHYLNDAEGYKTELYFLRDIDGREADFLVAMDGKPWFCVETKTQHKTIPSGLRYFVSRLNIPYAYQVVKETGVDELKDGIRTISADKFLTALC